MDTRITGSTAAEIADSVRGLHERGDLSAGAPLPSVRSLADLLGVNRNTVVAAYRQLTQTLTGVSAGKTKRGFSKLFFLG